MPEKSWDPLDNHYTYTLYYLAQVYGSLGLKDKVGVSLYCTVIDRPYRSFVPSLQNAAEWRYSDSWEGRIWIIWYGRMQDITSFAQISSDENDCIAIFVDMGSGLYDVESIL